ncbi:MAG: hypothetical protein ACOC8B_04800, partial [Gemmatimonadota bacterium]
LKPALASAALPGAGQWLTGSRRWLVYGLAEAGAWAYFLDRRGEGHSLERAYRELAGSVVADGNGGLSGSSPDFEYFEAMAHYTTSGAYDRDPEAPGLQPETDETTYNGSIWALARAMHIPPDVREASPDSPGYAAALDHYRRNAVPAELAWTWSGREEDRRRYADLIERSDAALRNAGRALGVILANHVISAVDAFVTARLAGPEGRGSGLDVRARRDRAGAVRWTAQVRIGLPRRR